MILAFYNNTCLFLPYFPCQNVKGRPKFETNACLSLAWEFALTASFCNFSNLPGLPSEYRHEMLSALSIGNI